MRCKKGCEPLITKTVGRRNFVWLCRQLTTAVSSRQPNAVRRFCVPECGRGRTVGIRGVFLDASEAVCLFQSQEESQWFVAASKRRTGALGRSSCLMNHSNFWPRRVPFWYSSAWVRRTTWSGRNCFCFQGLNPADTDTTVNVRCSCQFSTSSAEDTSPDECRPDIFAVFPIWMYYPIVYWSSAPPQSCVIESSLHSYYE